MTKINELTQNVTVNDGDLIPIWDSQNSSTRSISVTTLTNHLIQNTDIGNAYATLTIDGGVLSGVRLNGEQVTIGNV